MLFFQVAQGIEGNNVNMPLLKIILRIIMVELAEIFQGTSDGLMQFAFSHEYPKTLHTALSIGFHLDWQHFPVTSSQIVHFCIAPLGRVLPIMHLWSLETVGKKQTYFTKITGNWL